MIGYDTWQHVKKETKELVERQRLEAIDAVEVRCEEAEKVMKQAREALEKAEVEYAEANRAALEARIYYMSKVWVAWQSYKKETPNRGYWDDAMIEDIFSRQMWSPVNANEFEHVNSIQDVPRGVKGCIVVLPARHHAHEQWTDKLNDDFARFEWVVLMLIGDEESAFPAWRIKHRNCRIWLMMPRDQQDMHKMVHVRLPNGYPTDMRKYAGKFRREELEKPLDWFFSGQDTHERRHVLVEYGQAIAASVGTPEEPIATEGGVLIKTGGFTQGLEHDLYYKLTASAKIILCPCGAQAPDSFRFYEALESGCIPIADNKSTNGDYPPGYWKYLFREDVPFPTIDDWRQLGPALVEAMKDWRGLANRIGSWWLQYKRKLVYQLEADLNTLRESVPEAKSVKDKITVLISSSPIPSHPSPRVIAETINSVRVYLPECEIIIMQDGVRPEQEHLREVYDKYKAELLFNCRHVYHNVVPIFYEEFLHQAEMTRRTLDHIKTPLLLFMEHDTPLCEDRKIEWDAIVKAIESGYTDSVRFHHHNTEFLHPEHMDLAIDKCRQDVCGTQLVRTRQYSQRPHVATVDLYRRMLSTFSENCRTFIEDHVYGQFYEGKTPYKLSIYTPDGHIKRSRDLNGRENESKYDDRLIF